jgi:predicted nucleotidyltransferase
VRSTAVNAPAPVVPTHEDLQPLLEALKSIATALKADGVPFALAGSYAVYARGGARSLHDVDFVVPMAAIPDAVATLEKRGFQIERPPEDWLVKAYQGPLCVDLIHTLANGPVDAAMLERAEELPVESVRMPVLAATDLLTAKLAAMWEHSCDLEPVLGMARTLREQIDFAAVAAAVDGHAYGEAALFLLRRLGIWPGAGEGESDVR